MEPLTSLYNEYHLHAPIIYSQTCMGGCKSSSYASFQNVSVLKSDVLFVLLFLSTIYAAEISLNPFVPKFPQKVHWEIVSTQIRRRILSLGNGQVQSVMVEESTRHKYVHVL